MGKNDKLAVFYFEDALSYAKRAMDRGSICQSIDWVNWLRTKASKQLHEYVEFISVGLDDDLQVDSLFGLFKKSSTNLHALIHYELAIRYYKIAIKKLVIGIDLSFRAINECSYHYEECSKLLQVCNEAEKNCFKLYLKENKGEIMKDNLDELKGSMDFQFCIIDGL